MRRPGLAVRHGRRRRSGFLFLLPSLCGVILFVLLPFAETVRRSFTTAVTGEWAGLANYRTELGNEAFGLAAGNTLRFVLCAIPLLVLPGLLLALMLNRCRAVQAVKGLFLFPMAMPAATVVLVWKLVFGPQGFLNLLLDQAGGGGGQIHRDYMGSSLAFWVLVFTYVWKNLGYTVILWLAGIQALSSEMKEAALVDGAGRAACFFLIELPNLKPALYTITVLSFLNAFKAFREAWLVAGSYPDESIYLLQHMFNNWFMNLEYDRMAAAAVLVGAALFLVIRLLQRLWDV